MYRNIDCAYRNRRNNLFVDAGNWLVVQHMRQHYGKSYSYHYLYSDRNHCCRLQQYGDCYCFGKSFCSDKYQSGCCNMYRRFDGNNSGWRIDLFMVAGDRIVVQHMRHDNIRRGGNNYLYGNRNNIDRLCGKGQRDDNG